MVTVDLLEGVEEGIDALFVETKLLELVSVDVEAGLLLVRGDLRRPVETCTHRLVLRTWEPRFKLTKVEQCGLIGTAFTGTCTVHLVYASN